MRVIRQGGATIKSKWKGIKWNEMSKDGLGGGGAELNPKGETTADFNW